MKPHAHMAHEQRTSPPMMWWSLAALGVVGSLLTAGALVAATMANDTVTVVKLCMNAAATALATVVSFGAAAEARQPHRKWGP